MDRRHLIMALGIGSVTSLFVACSPNTSATSDSPGNNVAEEAQVSQTEQQSPSEKPKYSAYLKDEQGKEIEMEGNYRALAQDLANLSPDGVGSKLSVSVYNYADKKTFVFSPKYRGYEASIVKVPLALTAMRQAHMLGETLSESIREQVRASVGYSDNDATEMVYGSLGPDNAARDFQVNSTYDILGMKETRVDAGWGANLTGTEEQVKICKVVYEGVQWVSADDMKVLRDAMNVTDPHSQGWGVGVLARLEGEGTETTDLKPAKKVLCKNGWLPDDAGIWHVNSNGDTLYNGKTFAISIMSSGYSQDAEGRKVDSQAAEAVIRNLAI